MESDTAMAQPAGRQLRGSKVLEIAMRDVMDGLEESFCRVGYQPITDCMEILSIEAPGHEPAEINSSPQSPRQRAQVHTLGHDRQIDIVNYLIQREELQKKLFA